MVAFLNTAVSPINLPFTVLLSLVVLYWVSVMIGAMDMELMHSEWLPDLHVDDAGGMFHSVLELLCIGEVPIMVTTSFLIMFGWCFSLVANYYLNTDQSLWVGAGLLIPNLIVSISLTGLLLKPIRRLFRQVHQIDSEDQTKMFRVGVVITSRVTSDFGQVEIPTKGAPIVIHARTTDGVVFHKGDKVLVYDEDPEKGVYFVERYEDGDG